MSNISRVRRTVHEVIERYRDGQIGLDEARDQVAFLHRVVSLQLAASEEEVRRRAA